VSEEIVLENNLHIKVRWAVERDASNIARLELSSSQFENRAKPFTFTHPQFTELWVKRIKENNYKTMLACGAKELYGFLTFKNEIQLGHVLALYISPRYMRSGVGSTLLSIAEHMVTMKGGHTLEVDVEMQNNGAIAFYESLHFKKISVKSDHLIVMRKEIKNA
jgi:ribosomal protein S18 acetylase RimI-like enzyme